MRGSLTHSLVCLCPADAPGAPDTSAALDVPDASGAPGGTDAAPFPPTAADVPEIAAAGASSPELAAAGCPAPLWGGFAATAAGVSFGASGFAYTR